IRGKNLKDELEKYIASAKKHNLFASAGAEFYELLDELRRLRNRVHIQNTKGHFAPDDAAAFNVSKKEKAEQALEKTLKILAAKSPRPPHAQGHVADFKLPWDAHFPNM